jgi:hypothetical protein
LVGAGRHGGDWGWAEHVGGEGGAMVAWRGPTIYFMLEIRTVMHAYG